MKKIKWIMLFILILSGHAMAQRVTDGLTLLYDFTEIESTVIHDKVEGADALDLQIPDVTKIEWLNPGLRVLQPILVKTNSPRTKLDATKFFSNGITIEAWVKPLNNTQSGPARIVTFSQDSGNRNFTLGQSGHYYNQRFRTSVNPGNGTSPSTSTPANSIAATTVLQHVVYTRNSTGTTSFYIDKLKVQSISVPGDGSNWVNSYSFGLFNETNYPTDTRTWLGDIFLVAIYEKALTSSEITQNFDAGFSAIRTGSVTFAWDANIEPDIKGYKLYRGKMSRYDPSLPATIPETIKNGCRLPDEGPLTEDQQACKDSWEKYCTCIEWESDGADPPVLTCKVAPDPPDPMCDYDYFDYNEVIDVENVTEYEWKNIPEGKYFFAATAYDTRRESKFSLELVHTVEYGEVSTIKNLKRIPTPK